MKKLLLVTLLGILGFFPVLGETYMLPTSQGEKELYIPEETNDLRESFIEMASLYIEERFDHEKSLLQIEQLLSMTEDYKSYILKMESTTQSLITSLIDEQEDVQIFSLYLIAHYRMDFLKLFTVGELSPHLFGGGISVQLCDFVGIQLIYEIPTSLSINIYGKIY